MITSDRSVNLVANLIVVVVANAVNSEGLGEHTVLYRYSTGHAEL